MATISCHSNQRSYPIGKKETTTKKQNKKKQKTTTTTTHNYSFPRPIDSICEI